jgi:hypothetical protein
MDLPSHVTPEPDLRRQGMLLAVLSAVGTAASLAVWLRWGIWAGLGTLAAVFALLVAILLTGAAAAARQPLAVKTDPEDG